MVQQKPFPTDLTEARAYPAALPAKEKDPCWHFSSPRCIIQQFRKAVSYQLACGNAREAPKGSRLRKLADCIASTSPNSIS